MSSRIRRFTLAAASFAALLSAAPLAAADTWKPVDQMSAEDKARFDPATSTPRHPEFPYMPAEIYPFEAPYTAEEMGYRSAEFPHVSRWAGSILDVFGVITSSGYINQGESLFYLMQNPGEGFAAYLYDTKPGEVYTQWMTYDTFPPEALGTQQLWQPRRTDAEFRTKMDYFIYSPSLRRVRRQPEPRRDQRFPDNAQTFDDVIGRDPWEFEWQLLGTDVLHDTVRFPNTRPTITLDFPDTGVTERPTASIKMMGDHFPHYLPDGGVACWVVKATAKPDWLPGYSEKYLILWLEKNTFFPLRREKYDANDKLMTIEVRLADHRRPDLGDYGYSAMQTVYWNIENDLISYSFHDPHKPHSWTDEEVAMLFTAEFMRRDWLYKPLKSEVLIDDPEQYFLRPRLLEGRFPQTRNTAVPGDVAARIRAQDEAGHLVFETGDASAADH
jgi:hypothetical protein